MFILYVDISFVHVAIENRAALFGAMRRSIIYDVAM